jgi:hypothetical protein
LPHIKKKSEMTNRPILKEKLQFLKKSRSFLETAPFKQTGNLFPFYKFVKGTLLTIRFAILV